MDINHDFYCYKADLFDPEDGEAILYMLNEYAEDIMGGGEPITENTRINLIPQLQLRKDTSHVFLVRKYADANEPNVEQDMKKSKLMEGIVIMGNHGNRVQNKASDEAVGLAICFDGFSTFYCQKLLNIHDFAVSSSQRRKGLGRLLMTTIDEYCRREHYCKITLEVLEGNHAAKKLYLETGFAAYELDPVMGKAMFWQKVLEYN